MRRRPRLVPSADLGFRPCVTDEPLDPDPDDACVPVL